MVMRAQLPGIGSLSELAQEWAECSELSWATAMVVVMRESIIPAVIG